MIADGCGDWMSWGKCHGACGQKGFRFRTRVCQKPNQNGNDFERAECKPCPGKYYDRNF